MFLLEQNLVLGLLETLLCCVIIQLKDNALWVHNPLVPTEEFFEVVESRRRKVSHIVMLTHALEHKTFTKDVLLR